MHGGNASIPPVKRLLAAVLAAALPAIAAEDPAAGSFKLTLEPGGMHEECATLKKGEQRRYYWKSDGPVAFNVHFHEGDKVSYPVKQDGLRTSGGTFTARVDQDYCWMWTGRKTTAHVEGQVEIKPE